MYGIERKTEIIKALEQNGKVSVIALAEQFGASKETIRRDLKELEKRGVLTRTHGGAVSNVVKSAFGTEVIQEYPVDVRGIKNLQEKEKICKTAADRIKDQDILFVDNSSTCLSLLKYLPGDIHLTIITNSIKFLVEASKVGFENVDLYCIGGRFNQKNLSTFGTNIMPAEIGFYPDKCFISCNGISEERLITDGSILEVQTKKQMMSLAKETYLLADHTKFGLEGQYFLSDGKSIQYVITDISLSREKYSLLDHAEVIVAE